MDPLTAARPPRLLGFEEVKLWDVALRQQKTLLSLQAGDRRPGWYGLLRSAAFSPDGKRVAVPAGQELATVWDTASGRALYELPADSSDRQPLQSLAFLPEGESLVVADNRDVKRWHLKSGRVQETFQHHSGELAFAGGGELCAGAQRGYPDKDEGTVIYDARTGKEKLRIKIPHTFCTRFSPDGKRLATISSSGSGDAISRTIQLWDTATGKELLALPGWEPLAFSPDGETLALAGQAHEEVILVAIATGDRRAIRHDCWSLSALAFSPNGQVLACGGQGKKPRRSGGVDVEAAEGIITLFDVKSGERQADLLGHKVPVQVLGYSPDGRQLVSAGGQERLDPADTNWISSHGFDDEVLPLRAGGLAWCGGGLFLFLLACWGCLHLFRTKEAMRKE